MVHHNIKFDDLVLLDFKKDMKHVNKFYKNESYDHVPYTTKMNKLEDVDDNINNINYINHNDKVDHKTINFNKNLKILEKELKLLQKEEEDKML